MLFTFLVILVILCYKEEKEITMCLGGNRNRTDASVNNVASNGNYWSSEPVGGASQNSYNLNFNSDTGLNRENTNNRANGFGVRCVRIY